jgi:putative ATP-dependent endonuclease of OLD family
MNLSTIRIQNFRGIKDLTIDFNEVTVLIGENNSGKTSVLDAIRIALRDLRSKRGLVFEPLDFHLKDDKAEPSGADPIKFTLTFLELHPDAWPKEAVSALNRARILQVHEDGRRQVCLFVTGRYNASTSEFDQDWQFLDLAGNPLAGLPGNPLLALQEQVTYSYLSALRDAAKHFDSKGQYWRPFLKSSSLSPQQKSDIEELLRQANDAIIGSHTSFDTARDKLKELHDVVPLAKENVVSIDAVPARIFDMLGKTQISLGTSTGSKLPVDRHGEGTQSLAVLMLFNAFLTAWAKGSPIIALEEPEAHLHPSAVRALWRLIQGLPGQKIITTHSGDLVSEVPVAAVRRLRRLPGGVSQHRLAPTTLDATERRQFDFHVRQLRGELLLARCWLLVEGETEAVLLPEVASHLGLSFNRAGVRCVPYRQADIETYLKAANDLGIRWCVLADNDRQANVDIKKVQAQLNGAKVSDVLFQMDQPDIEQYLCAQGFAAVYETYLTHQTRAKIKEAPGQPEYWAELTKAVREARAYSKPAAALEVAKRIRDGASVPNVLEKAVRAALKLAEAG